MAWLGAVVSGVWPLEAFAEVMDKETVPWAPSRVLTTLTVCLICVGLVGWARRTRGWASAAAVVLAALVAFAWGVLALLDDFFSSDVGPAMRIELGRATCSYAAALLVQACAPLAAVLALAKARR